MEDLNIRKIFGENVKAYRKNKGLSQEQLAETLGISTNHLSVIETGTKFVSYKLLEKIITELGVMPATLFYTKGTEEFDETKLNKINSIIENEFGEYIKQVQSKISKYILSANKKDN